MKAITAIAIWSLTISAEAYGGGDCLSKQKLIGYPQQYTDLLCDGDNEVAKGNFEQAIQFYDSATKLDIFEFPNFKVFPKLAYAYCGSGKADQGLHILEDSICMVKIYSGEWKCYDPSGTDKRNRKEPITDVCFSTMCGELYLPYYEHQDAGSRIQIKKMKKEISHVKSFCQGILSK